MMLVIFSHNIPLFFYFSSSGLVPMTRTILLGTTIAAVAVMMLASPILADAVSSFFAVAKADKKTIDATIISSEEIEEVGAYGYGVITSAGLDGILVTTTHGGIQDSAAQTDAFDASFHNHYVALTDNGNIKDACPGLEVVDITWDAPGDVIVLDNVAVFDGPAKFKSTHSLTGEKLKFKTHGPVGAVVSFTIDPVDADGDTIEDVADLAAVCINDVTPAADPDDEPEEEIS